MTKKGYQLPKPLAQLERPERLRPELNPDRPISVSVASAFKGGVSPSFIRQVSEPPASRRTEGFMFFRLRGWYRMPDRESWFFRLGEGKTSDELPARRWAAFPPAKVRRHFILSGRFLRPYSPAQFAATRD